MCMAAKDCNLKDQVTNLDNRVTSLEDTVSKMRKETQDGIANLTGAINNLAHDFGERMNTMDSKLIEERAKEQAIKAGWHKVLQKIVTASALTILALAGLAAGLNIASELITHFGK